MPFSAAPKSPFRHAEEPLSCGGGAFIGVQKSCFSGAEKALLQV